VWLGRMPAWIRITSRSLAPNLIAAFATAVAQLSSGQRQVH
jgi:hypothetical protein